MKRLKSLFLGRPPLINFVYTEEQVNEIAQLTELTPGIVTVDDLANADLSEIEVIFTTWGMPKLTAGQLERLPKLKVVLYAAGATDEFAMPLLERGVRISSAWRANAIPVAEFTVAQIILSLKNYFSDTTAYTAPEATRRPRTAPGCYGETVALIGDGTIAHMVQDMLKAYKLNVIMVASLPENRTVSLEEAFSKAYVVSNHLFNHPGTEGMITREHFASMRTGATFINTGRGAQIDEAGLIEVLKSRPDLTALLDVTAPEPPVADSPLFTLPNAHLSTHIAGSIGDEVHRLADYAIEEYKRFATDESLAHEVTAEYLQRH